MDNAVVTLDVLHSGVIWGWYVTMNFWAKSIATGVFLLAPWLMKQPKARLTIPVIAFVFLNVTLLFTVLDLHQPMRFWHMFVYPHFTSVINLGAWLLTLYNGLLVLHIGLAWLNKDALYDKLVPVTWIVAFLATIYTAGLLGQANARELWHAATEVPQMLLAATLAGAAVFLLLRTGGDETSKWLSVVLGVSAGVSLTIYIVEVVLAPQKSEEAEYLVHLLFSDDLKTLFVGGLVLGFGLPVVMSVLGAKKPSPGLMMVAGLFSLVGLWLVKHAWLIAPQLIPLS